MRVPTLHIFCSSGSLRTGTLSFCILVFIYQLLMFIWRLFMIIAMNWLLVYDDTIFKGFPGPFQQFIELRKQDFGRILIVDYITIVLNCIGTILMIVLCCILCAQSKKSKPILIWLVAMSVCLLGAISGNIYSHAAPHATWYFSHERVNWTKLYEILTILLSFWMVGCVFGLFVAFSYYMSLKVVEDGDGDDNEA